MADWAAFAGFAGVVLVLLLLLAHASKSLVSGGPVGEGDGNGDGPAGTGTDSGDGSDDAVATPYAPDPRRNGESPATPLAAERAEPGPSARNISTGELLVNVALSQGLFAALLVVAAWYTAIPARAFGAGPEALGPAQAALGVVVGLALYAANEAGAALFDRFGFAAPEGLRESLAPDSAGGWVVLLLLVLPVIALFEELLFRGALVGVMAAGFGVSPWLLAAGSSVAFALGHGAQGRVGIVVTGLLGFVLAAAFVVTGSLLVVVVAHYVVNALEFAVHEGLDLG